MTTTLPSAAAEALRLEVSGAVQGVGFRPFVYRLAREIGLAGSVRNSPDGAVIEVEGPGARLEEFLRRLRAERPPASVIAAISAARLEPAARRGFEIAVSDEEGGRTAAVLPDLATCADCLEEVLDPRARRRGYHFTNCTRCGPRYTIVTDIPYDRPNTTMEAFALCEACRAEYESPEDRRFHAQPIACPRCGPSLSLAGPEGEPLPGDPLEEAAGLLRRGGILALKGIGGFQLMVDARDDGAVARLRRLKGREEKPFAVMYPSLESARRHCVVGPVEEESLAGPAAPIVLLAPRDGAGISPLVSASSPWVGAMLPASPLHHLLLRAFGAPVVATSGNRSEEPIATGNDEALARLGGVADAFLWHDRPIARACDDSVVRAASGRESVLRRARGHAPLPIHVGEPLPRVLALGAHLKSAVAIAFGRQVVLGQHLGDLESPRTRAAFRGAIEDLCRLYRFTPEIVACDLHPDYFSTAHAESLGLPVARVQHHHAHAAACAAENGVAPPWLGVAWDGTGYGLDGSIWGGEFFVRSAGSLERVAHVRTFRLPGGERASEDCRRPAFAVLQEALGDAAPDLAGVSEAESEAFATMIARRTNAPSTSSAGRLFDAAAAISGVARRNGYEGQAPLLLEAAIGGARSEEAYPAVLLDEGSLVLDWRPLVATLVQDVRARAPRSLIALRFHNALAEWIVEVARRAGLERVVLSGGVFQNAYLAGRACLRLEEAGFRPFTHHRAPPNDGGIALGQAVLAAATPLTAGGI